MIIGFDFDKVFIDYPPFIPDKLIDLLYKGRLNTKKKELHYRFPGLIERRIRLISHHHFFRRQIKENVRVLKSISKQRNVKTYLISSRFSFLEEATKKIIDRYKIEKYFQKIFFNFSDNQPHEFKEELIKKLKIEKYVDDDLDLSLYLAKKIPQLNVYWLSDSRREVKTLPKNVIHIRNLKEFVEKHL